MDIPLGPTCGRPTKNRKYCFKYTFVCLFVFKVLVKVHVDCSVCLTDSRVAKARSFSPCLGLVFFADRRSLWPAERHVHTGATFEIHKKHIDNGAPRYTRNRHTEDLLDTNARGRETNELQ